MTTLREAAQQALEALDGVEALLTSMDVTHLLVYEEVNNAITALKAALAEPVQEPNVPETNFWHMVPVGWLENPFGSFRRNWLWKLDPPPQTLAWSIPLYTAPQQRPAEPVQEPAPMPPFPPVSQWKRGCAVCGIGADGKAKVYGYVCPRSDCPTRVTCGGAV